MKHTRLLLGLLLSVNLFADDYMQYLTTQKQQIQIEKKKEIEAAYKGLKYNWINPLTLSASTSKNSNFDVWSKSAGVSLNQDLFRSGGILYALDYANTKREYDLLSLEIENNTLYQELYLALLNLKVLELELSQNDYQIKNADINIFLKRQQYQTGEIDITLLNDALMEKNTLLKSKLTLQESISKQKIALTALTDTPLEHIVIPTFTTPEKTRFLHNNLTLLLVDAQSNLSNITYKLTKTGFLPTLSVNGQYGYQDNTSDGILNQNPDNTYHNMGLTLSMPLDFNTKSSLQEAKAAAMAQKIAIADTKNDQLSTYEQQISQIQNYKDHIAVIEENLKLYKELITITECGFKSGYKTGYDLQTLQHTKEIDRLEIEIDQLNIQIESAKLTFAMRTGEEHEKRD